MGAVFLSYASQDAQPARKICDALRTAGIEVRFDQSELRGGDAWDQIAEAYALRNDDKAYLRVARSGLEQPRCGHPAAPLWPLHPAL